MPGIKVPLILKIQYKKGYLQEISSGKHNACGHELMVLLEIAPELV